MASQGKLRLESAREDKDSGNEPGVGQVSDGLDEKIRAAYDDLLREREATDLRLKTVKEEISKLEIVKEEREKVRLERSKRKATEEAAVAEENIKEAANREASKKRKINSVREGLWLFDGNNYTTVEEEDQDPTILK